MPYAISNLTQLASLVMLVLVGLLILVGIFFWPAFLHMNIQTSSTRNVLLTFPGSGMLIRLCLVSCHILLLICCDIYLRIHRKVILPIRYLLMPILMMVVKSKAIREEESVWYANANANAKELHSNSLSSETETSSNSALLMKSFSRHVRRDNKRKLRQYKNLHIQTATSHIDTFSLWSDVPVIINHERKVVSSGASSEIFLEAFIQRFLVVFMVTHAYIDRYYEEQDVNCEHPIAFCVFVQNGVILQSLMYFCVDEHNSSGIWQYQILRMMLRARAGANTSPSDVGSGEVGLINGASTCDDQNTEMEHDESDANMHTCNTEAPSLDRASSPTTPLLQAVLANNEIPKAAVQHTHARAPSRHTPIEYVNFQSHQDYAKKCVGASEALWDDDALMATLYPIQFFHEPPKHIVHLTLDIDAML